VAADKKTQILEAAIRLFAENGFHSTSIQEIADAAGVAKGSTYLYFKSKDDILLSIFDNYYLKMFDDIMNAVQPGWSPREKLRAQLRMQLEKFNEFRDFIKMQMREQFIHRNEEIKKASLQMRLKSLIWLRERILELYGEEIRPYSLDCTNMFQSIIGGYMGLMVMHGVSYELEELAEFLVKRLDDMALGLIRSQEKPIMLEADWLEYLRCNPIVDSPKSTMTRLIQQIRELAESQAAADPAGTEDLLASLQVLEEELGKEKPKRVIVQGMLGILQQSGINGMKKLVKQLQGSLPQ
jgi:AcrR family transcriptional regulator